jgi:hypothetical protein
MMKPAAQGIFCPLDKIDSTPVLERNPEKWTKDGIKVERMLYAGSNLDKAQEVFASAIYHRPRIRLTIRQRSHVLEEWPKATL